MFSCILSPSSVNIKMLIHTLYLTMNVKHFKFTKLMSPPTKSLLSKVWDFFPVLFPLEYTQVRIYTVLFSNVTQNKFFPYVVIVS